MLHPIERATALASAAVLFCMAMLMFIDVIGRNLFNSPTPGATELTELGMVALTFLLYPFIALRQKHITVDLFDTMTSVFVRRLQDCAGGVLGVILYVAIGWRMWELATRSAGYGDVTATLKLPLAWAYWFMSGMSWLTAAAFAVAACAAFIRPSASFIAPHAVAPKGAE